MNLAFVLGAAAHAGDREVVLRCAASVAAQGTTVLQDLGSSLAEMDPAERPGWCGPGSGELFVTLKEVWPNTPTDRLTHAFVVCVHEDGEATWSRVSYFRSWSTAVTPSDPSVAPRRVPKRLAVPHGIRAEGGSFPTSAIQDLQSYLDAIGFWEMPAETPSRVGEASQFEVHVVRASAAGRTNTVAGGGFFCSPMPHDVTILAGHLLIEPDPVAYLASKRAEMRERLEGTGQAPAP